MRMLTQMSRRVRDTAMSLWSSLLECHPQGRSSGLVLGRLVNSTPPWTGMWEWQCRRETLRMEKAQDLLAASLPGVKENKMTRGGHQEAVFNRRVGPHTNRFSLKGKELGGPCCWSFF